MPENLIISGHRIPSSTGETFNVIEPATGKVLAEVAKAGPADVDAAMGAAQRAFASRWASATPS